jgi:hypothetical protein
MREKIFEVAKRLTRERPARASRLELICENADLLVFKRADHTAAARARRYRDRLKAANTGGASNCLGWASQLGPGRSPGLFLCLGVGRQHLVKAILKGHTTVIG